MKNLIILACTISVILAIPIPSNEQGVDILQIPLQNNKELDVISLAEDNGLLNERNKRTIGILRELFPELSKIALNPADSNSIDVAALNSQLETINRVVRNTAAQTGDAAINNNENNDNTNNNNNNINNIINDQQIESTDQQKSIVESKAPAIDELTLDEDENDENRDKRFLSFGFGGNAGGSGGGAGGSGNFLFDVIRRTADRAARAAGTVYRVVAGTESLGINGNEKPQHQQQLQQQLKQQQLQQQNNNYGSTRTLTQGHNFGLFSGGTGTEQTDEQENSPDGVAVAGGLEHTAKSDGYTEGIPGPVTRLFVLANRGIANLIQDLILRLAATSERVVNFKARLITALI